MISSRTIQEQRTWLTISSMFFHLLFIHLFRPFLKYNQATSPLPTHVSPRKICTHAATTISKILRLYKRNYGLRQICNIAVYIAHSACTIHLLNLPDKNARRDIIHGVKHLEEIADSWLCARRTLNILGVLVRKWKIQLPEEAAVILSRTEAKFGSIGPHDAHSPRSDTNSPRTIQQPTPIMGSNADAMFRSNKNQIPRASVSPNTAEKSHMHDPRKTLRTQKVVEPNQSSQQQRYSIPQEQVELWNQDRAARGVPRQPQTSPSVLFGGVDSLIEESQDWWLKDQSALAMGFDNWNDMETEPTLLGNGISQGIANDLGNGPGNGFGAGINGGGNDEIIGNSMGYMDYGALSYGYNDDKLY